MLGVGLLSSFAVGAFVLRTRAFVPALRVLFLLATLGTAALLFSLKRGVNGQLLGSGIVLGIAAVPLLPLTLETAGESFFPVGDDASGAVLTMAGKALGALFLFVLQPLVGRSDCTSVFTPLFFVFTGLLCVSGCLIFAFKADYRRARAEEDVKESREGISTALLNREEN